ncbi:hypothetical protein FJR11_19725 [Anabaena sp. UHCC 0187]|uniref:hypothetical protein n=1 Tax=Anabaena sp. UHCC 0187 TaxID=2590018 RepID=UPI00144701AC|nr:hypothetical protein [Anabaena sp. UHCC 0187]MTJ14765.1 hypothetical protein [Anabaena sp. UHCC 0187]
MNHREILIDALNKAIARGQTAANISKMSGVSGSSLSRLIKGLQEDLYAGFYFSILDCLDEDIRKEALIKLGIKTEVQPEEMVKYLKGREIAKLIPFLDKEDKADIMQALALSLRSSDRKICA